MTFRGRLREARSGRPKLSRSWRRQEGDALSWARGRQSQMRLCLCFGKKDKRARRLVLGHVERSAKQQSSSETLCKVTRWEEASQAAGV